MTLTYGDKISLLSRSTSEKRDFVTPPQTQHFSPHSATKKAQREHQILLPSISILGRLRSAASKSDKPATAFPERRPRRSRYVKPAEPQQAKRRAPPPNVVFPERRPRGSRHIPPEPTTTDLAKRRQDKPLPDPPRNLEADPFILNTYPTVIPKNVECNLTPVKRRPVIHPTRCSESSSSPQRWSISSDASDTSTCSASSSTSWSSSASTLYSSTPTPSDHHHHQPPQWRCHHEKELQEAQQEKERWRSRYVRTKQKLEETLGWFYESKQVVGRLVPGDQDDSWCQGLMESAIMEDMAVTTLYPDHDSISHLPVFSSSNHRPYGDNEHSVVPLSLLNPDSGEFGTCHAAQKTWQRRELLAKWEENEASASWAVPPTQAMLDNGSGGDDVKGLRFGIRTTDSMGSFLRTPSRHSSA
ncbi:hypothetical protein AMATHDRAFT_7147 [Amanita thiersii Skay4041]|uniref:Uncharacterized protein n=1 Tax=Amanita thiersii Skay4041 TaxID=703135 RepID=A0A2A9NAA3_9AGAR|nr:hypothetical protein AMATHDRAFT_7147 [Amanita thiersii Skay4041]